MNIYKHRLLWYHLFIYFLLIGDFFMNRNEIVNILQNTLSTSRFEHCLRVEATALKLAAHFEVNPAQASSAALLHDYCREYPGEKLLQVASKFDIVIDELTTFEPLLLHGILAAKLAENELGIIDPQILEAIAFHITGGAGLSRLAQLIFICDLIEPGRTFPAARELRELALQLTCDQLLLRVYNQTISHVLSQGYLLHPASLAGRNELIAKGVR